MMPTMSGIELYERLLATHPELARRVVFFTGGATTAEVHDFLRSVPNRRIEKPFKVDALREDLFSGCCGRSGILGRRPPRSGEPGRRTAGLGVDPARQPGPQAAVEGIARGCQLTALVFFASAHLADH